MCISDSNTYNNKYIELDGSENHILNISDINNNDVHIKVVKEKPGLKGGNRKKKDTVIKNHKILKKI